MAEPRRPHIEVLAGTNGAGKSSVAGAFLQSRGSGWFNPDEAARAIRAANPHLTVEAANSAAWHQGRRLLERAIDERRDYAFESTLGGGTIPGLLARAGDAGIEVRIWYVGLTSPEMHIARVRARVAKGGHDIPEAAIRKRFDAGRRHLIELLPKLTELRVYDNSTEGDPDLGEAPCPMLVLHLRERRVVAPSIDRLARTPDWAKPIVAAALKLRSL